LELRLQKEKKDSRKVTYRFYVFNKYGANKRGCWRMTLTRVEYFPRLKTWRLIQTRPAKTKTGHTWWKQHTLCEFGDVPENEACSLAMATATLMNITQLGEG
jgi:hypothetical protein